MRNYVLDIPFLPNVPRCSESSAFWYRATWFSLYLSLMARPHFFDACLSENRLKPGQIFEHRFPEFDDIWYRVMYNYPKANKVYGSFRILWRRNPLKSPCLWFTVLVFYFKSIGGYLLTHRGALWIHELPREARTGFLGFHKNKADSIIKGFPL